jgi:hypothetical protein
LQERSVPQFTRRQLGFKAFNGTGSRSFLKTIFQEKKIEKLFPESFTLTTPSWTKRQRVWNMDLRPGQFVKGVALVAQGRSLCLPVLWLLFFGLSFHAFREEANTVGTVTGPSASVVPDVTIPSRNDHEHVSRRYSGNRAEVTGKISSASLLKFAPSMGRPMIHSRR